MPNFKILSDSSCDLNKSLKNKYNIDLIPFYVSFDKETYYKENEDISPAKFYKKLAVASDLPKTSLPSIQDYIDTFKQYLEKGLDILCICLSAKFSGSYQSAVNAASMLEEDYPDRKICIVNSENVSAGQGLLVLEACKMREHGMFITEIAERLEVMAKDIKLVCTVDSLRYLQMGGRIGKVSSVAGNLLNIKPIISMTDGELTPVGKVRGRKRALCEIIDVLYNDIKDNVNDYEIAVVNAVCEQDAQFLADTLKKDYSIEVKYPIFTVGVTIGTHIGPTAIGVIAIKKFDTYEY